MATKMQSRNAFVAATLPPLRELENMPQGVESCAAVLAPFCHIMCGPCADAVL